MCRLPVSLVAVAALAAGAAAQQRPLWSKDIGRKKESPDSVTQLAFTPDGRALLVQGLSHGLHVPLPVDSFLAGYDLGGEKERFRRTLGGYSPLSQPGPFAFARDDLVLVATGGQVELVSCRDGQVVSARPAPGAATAEDRTFRHWWGAWVTDDGSGYTLLSRQVFGAAVVRGTFVRGKDDAVGWQDAGPDGLALPRPEKVGSFPADWMRVYLVAVNGTGTRLATYQGGGSGRGGVLTLHALGAAGRPGISELARVESPHPGEVKQFRFNPAGTTLATAAADGTVKLWDDPAPGARWKARASLAGSDFTVHDVAFRPDGKVMAFGSLDMKESNVWLADVASGRSPDTKNANVWLADVASGKVVKSFRAAGGVTAVAFSPDGKTLATGNHQGHLEVWDVEQLLAGQKK